MMKSTGAQPVNGTGHADDGAILVAYGSNLLSSIYSVQQDLDHIVAELKSRGVILTKISSLWRSQAWPDPADPPYLNAVLDVATESQPFELMQVLHDIEREFGRVRDGQRNAPRRLDLDLIAYGRHIFNGEHGLILPHPRAAERGFVMGPLAEILPGWVHPLLQRTARDLHAGVTVAHDAHPVDEAERASF